MGLDFRCDAQNRLLLDNQRNIDHYLDRQLTLFAIGSLVLARKATERGWPGYRDQTDGGYDFGINTFTTPNLQ